MQGAPPAASAGRALTPGPRRALSLQSSTQEIGEELVNGVVYSISLRKVQVHPAASRGQRRLGVSVGRPGSTGRPGTAPTCSQGFPALGPRSPAPRGISPAPRQVQPLLAHLCEHQKGHFHWLPFSLRAGLGVFVRLACVSCFGCSSPLSRGAVLLSVLPHLRALASPHLGRAVFTPERVEWGLAARYSCL